MHRQERVEPASVRKLSYRDFVKFPDDGRRHELIDGVHYVTPSPVTKHQRVVRELLVALTNFLKTSQLGEAFDAPFDVVLSNHDIVEPDLMVVLKGQSDIVTDKHVRGAPAIVVEVLSPGTRPRDERLKRDLYARVGVREYWLVDPKRHLVTVATNVSGTFEMGAPLSAATGNSLTSPLLPGFALTLADLFLKT